MPLSEDEQRRLDEIERALYRDDPTFASEQTLERFRRRRMVAAGLPLPVVLVSADEIEHGKPHPDGYLRAAELLGVLPQACVVFEDAEPGVRSALDAGARVVVVGNLVSSYADGLERVSDLRHVTVLRSS